MTIVIAIGYQHTYGKLLTHTLNPNEGGFDVQPTARPLCSAEHLCRAPAALMSAGAPGVGISQATTSLLPLGAGLAALPC